MNKLKTLFIFVTLILVLGFTYAQKQSDLKIGIAGKRKICGWDEKFRDKILGIDFIRQNR